MLYFHCRGKLRENEKSYRQLGLIESGELQELQEVTQRQRMNGNEFLFISKIEDDRVEMGAILENSNELMKRIKRYLSSVGFAPAEMEYKEVTVREMDHLLDVANIYHFIRDSYSVLDMLGMGRYRYAGFEECRESVISESSKEKIREDVDGVCLRDALLDELDRIYQGKKMKSVIGHPVHYMIQTDDEDVSEKTVTALVQALYENGRIDSRRINSLAVSGDQGFRPDRPPMEVIFKYSLGTTLVLHLQEKEGSEEREHANAARSVVSRICRGMKKYRNQVLTILCLPKECTKLKEWFGEYLDDMSIVELKETFVSAAEAREILKKKAGKQHVRPDQNLLGNIRDEEEYLLRDLNRDFDRWFNEKLRRSVYPQYYMLESMKRREQKEKPRGSAYDELNRMIGLKEAKKVIHQALAFFKAQKLFRDKGMSQERPAMHMVFTGNPGTAKTTVARLFAKIMKDNGILSTGTLVEVGRSGLVGKYVGWTAPIVKGKFMEAKGGVLFIDEAYSLVDDRDGMYGDEAINTIVQEMENHRDDVIVIFAGYPDKMEKFLEKNPGLRSRIAFHVPFEDYDVEELCEIAELQAEKIGLHFADDVYDRLCQNFAQAVEQPDFGNGRYVRNVIEKARMEQSKRLIAMDEEKITKEELETLQGQDIEIPQKVKRNTVKFGFCG